MLRKSIIIILAMVMIMTACTPSTTSTEVASATEGLIISDGATQKTYSMEDLKGLPPAQVAFKDITYVGAPLKEVLKKAGFAPEELKAVKAVASDGYTVNYTPEQFLSDEMLVAYAQADGPLSADDGSLRIVFPGEGKLNVRMLTKIEVVK